MFLVVLVGAALAVPLSSVIYWLARGGGQWAQALATSVTTIGLVTIATLIGLGGLGSLIYTGLLRDFSTPAVVGSVLSVALAVVVDGVLLGAQRLATPWARGRTT